MFFCLFVRFYSFLGLFTMVRLLSCRSDFSFSPCTLKGRKGLGQVGHGHVSLKVYYCQCDVLGHMRRKKPRVTKYLRHIRGEIYGSLQIFQDPTLCLKYFTLVEGRFTKI